jgi:hypothetical protein
MRRDCQLRRFLKPDLMSGVLGIVPSERTSDTKRRQGSITKAGPGHAREGAHHHRRRPATGDRLARPQQGQAPRVIETAWRAQRRLYQRAPTAPQAADVAAIAVARGLAGFLWEAATLD